jgi:elongator complex protein 3
MSHSITKKFILEALQNNLSTLNDIELLKRNFSKRHNIAFLRNPEIKKVYSQMLEAKEITANHIFEALLVTKKIRTLSGIAAVAVLTKPYPCPGQCLYCPDEKAMPKSYLSNEPAVMRAINSKFHPYHQMQARLRALQLNGHATDKIELIVMGGTFSYFPKTYQRWFIRECFRAANNYQQKKVSSQRPASNTWDDLFFEQKKNEKMKNRIVGLTLETRPDYIDEKEIINFRKLGCTRVELGVQSIDDDILKKNKRGHLVSKTIEATKLLKNAGFKINYHLMPGLYGSTPTKDLQMFRELFSNPDFQPDMIKIYPCVVTKDSALYKLWQEKKYTPLNNKKTEELICAIKQIIPPYVRITRLIRDIPEESIEAGPNISNLRQLVQEKGIRCRCIRCREVKGTFTANDEIVLDRIEYDSSDGKEIFLQYVSPDKRTLYALLRLRLPTKNKQPNIFKSLKNTALIREIHTYGKLLKLSEQNEISPQHIGLGKKLLQTAENIAKQEFGFKKIAVISGVGVRNYYRKFGYRLKETYMIKSL